MEAGWSRRAFLGAIPLLTRVAAGSELKRFRDPATEFDLIRLTDPSSASYLPPVHLRSATRRSNALIFSSERAGSLQVFRMDLKTGETRQLTEARNLDHRSVSLTPDERSICFIDGRTLMRIRAEGGKLKEIYSVPEGWDLAWSFGLAGNGQHSVLVEKRGDTSRIRLIRNSRGSAGTVVETNGIVETALPRPRKEDIVYRKDAGLWLVNYNGRRNHLLKLASGRIGPFHWSADGKAILYLLYPDDPRKLNELREHVPESSEDKLIASTSQFVNFAPNGDSSVFVGVSRNKASPYILLLLRVPGRELTLCEHRAAHPEDVVVLFSPNSQRLYFHTDRANGAMAIYSMEVERFVEETDTTEPELR
ncbi:MAG: oligogalacturonate lyase family protein [Bryobacteraceae bacterium]